jgi:subtilisin
MSMRVFPPGNGDANQGDVALAIDFFSTRQNADLINLSIYATQPSEIEHDAIRLATKQGTLCIAAAGNDGTTIGYPAAFQEVVSVSALGLKTWGPAGSEAAVMVPTQPDRFGQNDLYIPVFSSFGQDLTCTGPGVGLISTAPARFGLAAPFIDLTGTSCAAPLACAALASLLADSPAYRACPRTRARAEFARQILFANTRSIDLAESFQGRGVPQVIVRNH